LSRGGLAEVPDGPGVYELGDEGGNVVYIGSSGQDGTLFSRIARHLSEDETNACIRGRARRFRFEETDDYIRRELDLLAAYQQEHSRRPICNEEAP
jgi:excinuclease UvrABC nuclease subunit